MNHRNVLAAACAYALATTSVIAQQPGESGRQERLSHIHAPAALADPREPAETLRVKLVEAADIQAAEVAGQARGRSTQPPVSAVPPPPPPPAPPAPAAPQGQPVNVKVEFTITDQREGAAAVKRTISVIVADRNLGRVRSVATVIGPTGLVPLDVDATPIILNGGKLKLQFTLSYDLPGSSEMPPAGSPVGRVAKTAIQDSVSLILENGRSMVAAQSVDPIGDRQVTVEVKATILK